MILLKGEREVCKEAKTIVKHVYLRIINSILTGSLGLWEQADCNGLFAVDSQHELETARDFSGSTIVGVATEKNEGKHCVTS